MTLRPTAPLLLAGILALVVPVQAIVGGSVADEGEYPWQVAITSGDGSSQYCGGTLVDRDTVVTAAHCMGGLLGIPLVDDVLGLVLTNPVYVQVGTNHLDAGGESIQAITISVHPDYDSDHDVAILQLERQAVLGSPIPYARPGDEALYAPGTLATVTGWGLTSEGGSGSNELREVQIPILDDAQCAAAYGSSTDAATEFCAGYPQGGKDSCQGDSGGPVVVPDGHGGHLLVGIVSWGEGCARAGKPGVYAEVAALADFIDANDGDDAVRTAAVPAPAAPSGLLGRLL